MPTFHNFSEMPTLLSRVKRAMSADSVELMALRICCCAMPCALLLYLLIQYRAFGSDYIGDWYGYLISIGLASCGVFLLVAAIVGKLTWLRYSLYWNAVVLVTAMIMFPVAYYTMTDLGPSILRFTDFTGLLAISVVLLSPTKRAVIAAILIQAIPGAMHAIVYSRTSLPELITASGFAVLMSLIPFVLGAVTLMRVARTIDEIEERVRNSLADSECKRAGIAERKRLNGLVHDHILASLAAIARGQTLTASSTLSLPSRPATGEDIPLQHLLADVKRSLHDIVPDCEVIVSGSTTHASIKASAAEAIRLSVAEAARNSCKHAGVGCQRRCKISVVDGELTVELSDNGRGFDVVNRDPQRSGIQVSILHRMRSIDGGDATITSAEGVGTTVTVRWCLRSVESQQFGANAETATEISESESTAGSLEQRLLQPAHVSRAWARPYLALAVITVLCAAWISDGRFLAALPAAITSIVVLALILLDNSQRISGFRRAIIMVGFIAIGPLSLWQSADYHGISENHWALAITTLVSSILVLRGMVAWALVGFFANAGLMHAISFLSAGAIDSPSLVTILSYSNLIIAAAVVYFANSSLLKSLPKLRAKKRTANAEAARIQQVQSVYRRWHERIELDAAPVFEAVQHFSSPPPLLRQRAHLTELAIRDVLRAPLLDRPELKAAVWDARNAGATVLLLDDRSERVAGDGRDPDDTDAASAMEKLIPVALQQLLQACEDKITIRVLPPGRKYFATISSDANGMTRIPFPKAS